MIIIFIGLWAIGLGQGDVSRVMEFKTATDGSAFWPVIAATTLAFFAMVGFEDSVNMAEECEDPTRIFPKVLLAGLLITGLIYVLVSISAITLVAPEQLGEGETPLLQVVQAGAPSFPVEIFGFITMFAVANSALINMLMASRLVYGMSRERVLPTALGKVHPTRRTPYIAIGFTTLLAFGLITFVGEVPALGGTTALLLLCVFTVVNVAVLVLRRDRVDHKHFRTPTILPILGAVCCAFLAGPWTGRDPVQYRIAGSSTRHRRRAVGRDRAGQSRHRPQARGADHGRHRRTRAGELECRTDLEYCYRRVRAGRTKQQREESMQTKLKLFAFATVAIVPMILTGDLQAQQQPPQPPQFPNMTFFITSTGGPNGANFGGIEGADKHCQALAAKAGAGAKTWRAYLSVQANGGAKAINARDRIGNGPWVNAAGVQIASSVADLHSDNNKINEQTIVAENGRRIPTRLHTVNQHDILTGTQMDGTAPPARQGPDLQQLDQRQRRLRRSSDMPTAWAPATTRRRSHGTRRIRRAAVAIPSSWRPAAPDCSIASPRTDTSTGLRQSASSHLSPRRVAYTWLR